MGRPKDGGRGLMTGESSFTRSSPVPQVDDCPVWGLVLAAKAIAPRAADVFTAEELEARIQAHAERVAREGLQQAAPIGAVIARKNPPLADDVKICRCAACSTRLFGESMRGRTDLPSYTPFVAGRKDDRPYCPECLRLVEG